MHPVRNTALFASPFLRRLDLVKFIKERLVDFDTNIQAQQFWGYTLHAIRETLELGKFLSF